MMKQVYPLTHAQQIIWDVEKFIPNTSINNIMAILNFKEELDFKLLEQAINLLIKKTIPYGYMLNWKMESRFNASPSINLANLTI